jgi:hypothetical protein
VEELRKGNGFGFCRGGGGDWPSSFLGFDEICWPPSSPHIACQPSEARLGPNEPDYFFACWKREHFPHISKAMGAKYSRPRACLFDLQLNDKQMELDSR